MKEYPIVKVFPHEKYDRRTFDYDIAILELGLPFHIEEGVIEPIMLDRTDPAEGTNCNISGWGTQKQVTSLVRSRWEQKKIGLEERRILTLFIILFRIQRICQLYYTIRMLL